MTREDANVRTLADLRGKRVSLGPPGSGTRATMDLVMDARRASRRATSRPPLELKFVEMSPALCENKIDAFVFVAGHPQSGLARGGGLVQDADHPGARRADRRAAAVEAVLREGGDSRAGVQGHRRRRSRRSGRWPRLCVSEDMPEDVAYAITKSVFDNFEDFQKLHPALVEPDERAGAAGRNGAVPSGAVRYFKEAG